MVLEVDKDLSTATIIASANAQFVNQSQVLEVANAEFLKGMILQPMRVHSVDCDIDRVLSEQAEFADEVNDVFACKAVPRIGTECFALAVLTDTDSLARVSTVLMTLSELLIALCKAHDAVALKEVSQASIVRAKEEWEGTVDALSEIVCLIDHDGYIVRTNRAIERWRLGEVRGVAGIHVHELLHPGCRARHCQLKDATSQVMAAKTSDGQLKTIISDSILNRTIHVHIQLTSNMPTSASRCQPTAVVVVTDVTELHQAQDELAVMNRSLESRVEQRTAELANANLELNAEMERRSVVEAELQNSRDELALLTQRLIEAQEDERRRVSRELHDSLGQSLGAIKYSLEVVLAQHGSASPEKLEEDISVIVQRMSVAIKEARMMAVGLRPPALDDIGTTAALETLCKDFASTYRHIAFHVELDARNDEIPEQLATPVYRIVQEALNNVIKHSSAETVLISLRVENEKLRVEVLDDGVGFDNTSAGSTGTFMNLGKVGRLGMRERAINSNGVLTIESWPGEGTRVLSEWALVD
jgi:signal transduction histidine kinase